LRESFHTVCKIFAAQQLLRLVSSRLNGKIRRIA
jgi:hypothetical protein